jgi:hypothetical protein
MHPSKKKTKKAKPTPSSVISEENKQRIIALVNYWNLKKIVTHTITDSLIDNLYKSLKKRQLPMSAHLKAIDNYAHVMGMPTWWNKYKWPLKIFIVRDTCEQFYGENFILSNYENNKQSAVKGVSGINGHKIYDFVCQRVPFDDLTEEEKNFVREKGGRNALNQSDIGLKKMLGI